MIIGEIKRFLRDDGSVKVSRILKSLSYKINIYLEDCKNNGLNPTVEEIAKKFDIDEEDVLLAIGSQNKIVSIYDTTNDDGDKPIELIDKISSDDKEDDFIEKMMLKKLIGELPEKEKKIIVMRYFNDKTQLEIAEELGVSQVQVSRLETKIIEKLRQKM